METVTRVLTSTDNISFGYWNNDTDEFVPLSTLSDTEEKEIAELFGCTPLLVDALIMLTADIKENIGADLIDIWKAIGK